MVSRSYVGCIKNVEIARSNFDLLRDAFGVRKGCVLEVRKYLGNGRSQVMQEVTSLVTVDLNLPSRLSGASRS